MLLPFFGFCFVFRAIGVREAEAGEKEEEEAERAVCFFAQIDALLYCGSYYRLMVLDFPKSEMQC